MKIRISLSFSQKSKLNWFFFRYQIADNEVSRKRFRKNETIWQHCWRNLCEFIPSGTTSGKKGLPVFLYFILFTVSRVTFLTDILLLCSMEEKPGTMLVLKIDGILSRKKCDISYNSWPYYIWTGCISVQCFTFYCSKTW